MEEVSIGLLRDSGERWDGIPTGVGVELSGKIGDIIGEDLFLREVAVAVENIVVVLLAVEREEEEEKLERLEEDSGGNVDWSLIEEESIDLKLRDPVLEERVGVRELLDVDSGRGEFVLVDVS